MALQLGYLRDALIEAGASTASADRAAEEVASYENRLAGIERKLVFSLLTWMVGGLYGLLTVVGLPALWLLLKVADKVGALG
jgi:hypothetical protein